MAARLCGPAGVAAAIASRHSSLESMHVVFPVARRASVRRRRLRRRPDLGRAAGRHGAEIRHADHRPGSVAVWPPARRGVPVLSGDHPGVGRASALAVVGMDRGRAGGRAAAGDGAAGNVVPAYRPVGAQALTTAGPMAKVDQDGNDPWMDIDDTHDEPIEHGLCATPVQWPHFGALSLSVKRSQNGSSRRLI